MRAVRPALAKHQHEGMTTMATRFGISAFAVITSAALVAAGCGGSSSDDAKGSTTSTAAKSTTHDSMTDTMSTGGDDASATASPAGMLASSKAADTQLTLDRLLAEHAFLADVALQKVVDGSKDTKS